MNLNGGNIECRKVFLEKFLVNAKKSIDNIKILIKKQAITCKYKRFSKHIAIFYKRKNQKTRRQKFKKDLFYITK